MDPQLLQEAVGAQAYLDRLVDAAEQEVGAYYGRLKRVAEREAEAYYHRLLHEAERLVAARTGFALDRWAEVREFAPDVPEIVDSCNP